MDNLPKCGQHTDEEKASRKAWSGEAHKGGLQQAWMTAVHRRIDEGDDWSMTDVVLSHVCTEQDDHTHGTLRRRFP